jgi:seryl-tRNA synthetase
MPEASVAEERPRNDDQVAFRDALLDAGILHASGVRGIYGKGPSYVAALEGLDRFVTAAGVVDEPEVYRFPAVFPVEHLLQCDYLRSFPDLVGSIHGFEGGNKEHAALLRDVADGAEWDAYFKQTDLVMLPAACYPLYPMATGELPPGGRLFDVLGTCFRKEPSDDPARMQAFQMHEFVHVGTPESTVAFRDDWLARQQQMMQDLGLQITVDVANDPFFGRAGSMLAANQRDNALKYELLATVSSEAEPTAIASCNRHTDHLTSKFGISAAGGNEAHSACAAFGMDRIVLALYAAHGLDSSRWPDDVCRRLWP